MSKKDLVESLQDIIDTINDGLEKGADKAAFFCALSIPDICAQIEYSNSNIKKMDVGERYSKWYDENIFKFENSPVDIALNQLDGEILYWIRCKMYHEGELFHKKTLKKLEEKYIKLASEDATLNNLTLDKITIEFVSENLERFGSIRFKNSKEIDAVRFHAYISPKNLAQKLVWTAEGVIRNFYEKNNPTSG